MAAETMLATAAAAEGAAAEARPHGAQGGEAGPRGGAAGWRTGGEMVGSLLEEQAQAYWEATGGKLWLLVTWQNPGKTCVGVGAPLS